MRRETFILMSVFVLLGVGFIFLQLKNKPLVDPDRTFHIEDKRRVHEVFITHRDGEQVKLSRKGTSTGTPRDQLHKTDIKYEIPNAKL